MDSDGFDEFYWATSHRLLKYAYAMSGDLGAAQDLTQEAYVRAWQNWRRISRYEHAESWLRLVVTRLATDRWRRLGARRRAEALSAFPGPAPPPSDDGLLLASALRRIPANERRALALYYLMDLSIADIAAETGAPVGTVKSWLSRGRASLAAVLDDSTPAVREGNGVQ